MGERRGSRIFAILSYRRERFSARVLVLRLAMLAEKCGRKGGEGVCVRWGTVCSVGDCVLG